jgi:hypothetical protein
MTVFGRESEAFVPRSDNPVCSATAAFTSFTHLATAVY